MVFVRHFEQISCGIYMTYYTWLLIKINAWLIIEIIFSRVKNGCPGKIRTKDSEKAASKLPISVSA